MSSADVTPADTELAEGKLEGLAEGKLEGLAEGKLEALFVVLAMRGLAPDPTDRARILGERDPDRLDRWIARATTCTSLAQVFDDPWFAKLAK